MKAYGIRLVGLVGMVGPIRDDVPDGAWLQSYDPEAYDGGGDAAWTDDPALALAFATQGEALECYRQVPTACPLRPDGRPNRPLTVATISIEPIPEEAT